MPILDELVTITRKMPTGVGLVVLTTENLGCSLVVVNKESAHRRLAWCP